MAHKETKNTATTKNSSKKAAPKRSAVKKSALKKAKKTSDYVPNMKLVYQKKVIPAMIKRFGYKNVMEVPRLMMITLNMGIGDAKTNPKSLEIAQKEMMLIAGQKPVVTLSKKDISNFKIRHGFLVGCKVNLRNKRMYEFLERLVAIALPRTRDFNGLSFKSFDRRGNYSFGVKEQIIFTEIDYDKIDSIRGMDVVITTTSKTDEEAYWLLKEMGFPLREKPQKHANVLEAA